MNRKDYLPPTGEVHQEIQRRERMNKRRSGSCSGACTRRYLAAFALLAVSAAGGVFAQSGSQPAQKLRTSAELQWLQQEGVVVTSDRAPRRSETIASNITVITAEQIERSGAKQVPDLLRYVGGVEVTDFFGNGRQARVDIRGFGINADSSVLVLVDGRRINGVTLFNTDWTTIPLERVSRIEVVRGGNSVLYGNQAVGGIVNIITKRGSVEKELVVGAAAGSYGYLRPYASFSGTELVGDGPLTYNLSASRSDENGYRVNSDFRNDSAGLSLDYDLGKFFVEMSGGIKDDSYGLAGSLAPSEPRRSSTRPLDRSDTKDAYVHLVPTYRLSDQSRIAATIDARKLEQRGVSFGFTNDDVSQISISPHFVNESRFDGARNRLMLGLDLGNSTLKRDASGISNQDNRQTTRAWFFHDTIALRDETLFVDIGHRQETFRFDLQGLRVTRNVDARASKLAATWNYQPGSKLFAAYDRSYRVQLLDEIGQAGNEILRPQITDQVQLGMSHRLGGTADLRAAYFRLKTKDEILFDPTKGLFGENANVDDNRRTGVDLELTGTLTERVNGFLAYTFSSDVTTAGQFKDRRLPLTAPRKGAAGVTATPAANWWVDLRYRWTSNKVMDGDLQNTGSWKSSWQVLDLGVTHKWRQFKFAAGIQNLFDEKYVEYGFFNPAFGTFLWPLPGRTVYLSVSMSNVF